MLAYRAMVMKNGTGTAGEDGGGWCLFCSVIREGGDAYVELKSASSPAGGGEVDYSWYFNSPINPIK